MRVTWILMLSMVLASCNDPSPDLDCALYNNVLSCDFADNGDVRPASERECRCLSDALSDIYVESINACGGELSCGDIESCLAAEQDDVVTPEEQSECYAYVGRCGGARTLYGCEILNTFKLLSKDHVFRAYLDCYALPCDEVQPCQEDVDILQGLVACFE
jgi:hypothetical protein